MAHHAAREGVNSAGDHHPSVASGPDQSAPDQHGRDRDASRVDDIHYAAYSMGAAAEILDVTPDFLRSLGDAGLLVPQRSAGRHRRYSRHQLDLAARARALVDSGLPVAAASRIILLEDKLAEAERTIADLKRRLRAHERPDASASAPAHT